MAGPLDPTPSRSLAIVCEDCGLTYVTTRGVSENCPKCGAIPKFRPANTTALYGGQAAHPPESEVDELIGETLDVYEIDRLLGKGAMGRVYLARHRDLERDCALKILPPALAEADAAYVARFINEGKATAALVHPNIVTVHAIGEERGYNFLEMEFLPGMTLAELLKEEGRQTPERATQLVARIGEGLAMAHTEGILHRDLKLDNVLLTLQGIPKIADFGLAKRVFHDPALPGSQEIVGTPAYMAPELFDSHPANPTTDVYALGVCYYLLLTGQFPYYDPNALILANLARTQEYPDPHVLRPEISLDMAELLHRMLSKTPAHRPQSAHEATQHLYAILGQTEDLGDLLRQAFQGQHGVSWRKHFEGYRIDVTFAHGRAQAVYVEPSGHGVAERLLTITSICAKRDPDYFETALRLNADLPHGAVSLREIEGEWLFVMRDTYPRSTVDAEEIRRSVIEVAHRADAVELLLTNRDHY